MRFTIMFTLDQTYLKMNIKACTKVGVNFYELNFPHIEDYDVIPTHSHRNSFSSS